MLKFTETDITFKEVPNKICRCFSVSNCGLHCKNCHSPELQGDNGTELTERLLQDFIRKDKRLVECYVFLGEGKDPEYLESLLKICKNEGLETCIYTGQTNPDLSLYYGVLDYIKTGPYIEELGGLNNPNTNQRFYQIDEENKLIDRTSEFYNKDRK